MADQERSSVFVLSDKWYNFLKRLVQVIIPAFGTFYVTLGPVWDFPRGDDVAKTCLALATFLGICLGISNAQYNASGKGIDGNLTMVTSESGAPRVTGLDMPGVSDKVLEGKKTVTLQVKQEVPVGPEELDEHEDEEIESPQNPATRRKPR